MDEEIRYRKNFLTNVIFRLDFIPINEINKTEPGEFWEGIKSEFPHRETKNVTTRITFFKDRQRIEHESRFPLYQFADSDNEKSINLTNSYLTIEFFKYQDFSSFKEVVEKTNFFNFYTPSSCTRLGLRYINQIVLAKDTPLSGTNI